ncbi:MAG: sigma-70 family RNA polymerase sigma factor [Acetobacteraceae bacterium]|nr:sigma-70 family RNA polymerase sigma factor [Acetobacteraceae bacterium]
MTELLPELRAFARFLVRDRSEADDLVQEALVRALGALARFQQGTSMRAWLFTILRNAFYEQARRRRTEKAALEQVGVTEQASAPHQENETALADLQRLIWTLPPLLREALVLVGAQGLAHEEAAKICNVPVGTMKARVSRARAKISQALEEERSGGHLQPSVNG